MKMDGTELDGLVEYLRGKDFCPEAADVITAMRAEIADLSLQACQDGDLISELITELNEQTHRVARAEAALAAQIEVGKTE